MPMFWGAFFYSNREVENFETKRMDGKRYTKQRLFKKTMVYLGKYQYFKYCQHFKASNFITLHFLMIKQIGLTEKYSNTKSVHT